MYSSTFSCAGSLLLASFSLAVMSGGCAVAAGLLDLGARCPWTWLHRWGVPKSHRPGVHLLNGGTRSSWLALWAGSCRMVPVCWWVLKPPATTGYSLDPKWGLLVLASTWMNRLLKTASANVLVPRQNNQLSPNSLQVFPRSASGADPGFFPANCLHTETGNMWEFACGAESVFYGLAGSLKISQASLQARWIPVTHLPGETPPGWGAWGGTQTSCFFWEDLCDWNDPPICGLPAQGGESLLYCASAPLKHLVVAPFYL